MPVAGAWDFLVGTWDGTGSGSKLRLYVNGELVSQKAMTTAPGAGGTFFEFGSYGNGTAGTSSTARSIEVAVWDKALPASTIRALYRAGRGLAVRTAHATYDGEGHSVASDDEFLASGGFEDGLADWDLTGGTGGSWFSSQTAGDADVHAGFASFKTGPSGTATQIVSLLPGQTVRLQVAAKTTGTALRRIAIDYWSRAGQAWTTLDDPIADQSAASWTAWAWDATLPLDSDGRVRLSLGVTGAGANDGVVYDDAVLVTTWATATFNENGTRSSTTTLARATAAQPRPRSRPPSATRQG